MQAQRAGLLLAVLAVGAAAALPAVPAPALAADLDAGAVRLHVEAAPAEVSAYVVVHHDDPLLGAVVDRVVPVDLGVGDAAEVRLDQLRGGLNLTVDLVPQKALDDLVADVSSLVNGTKLPDLPLLGSLDLGALLPSRLPLDLYAYPFADYGTNLRHARVLATPTGVLAVAYLVAPFDDGSVAEPIVRLSRDGSHRFEPPIRLDPDQRTSPAQGSNQGVFEGLVAPDGSMVFVTAHDGADHRLANWTVSRLDPVTSQVTARTFDAPRGAVLPNYSPVVFADGSVLVVSHGPLGPPTDHTGPEALWFGADGTFVGSHDLEQSQVYMASDEVWARSGPHGEVAVVWKTGTPAAAILRYATSLDGGRTWAPARNVTGLPAFPGMEVGLAMDELGTLHLAVNLYTGPEASLLRYVRIPAGQEPVVSALRWPGAPIELASNAVVAAAGGRAWVLANVATEVLRHGGNAFSARFTPMAWEILPAPLGMRDPDAFTVKQGNFHFGGRPALSPDGRLVVTGDSSSGGYAVVPLFDPFPEPACSVKGPVPSGTPTPGPAAPATCGERFTFQALPGLATVKTFRAAATPTGDRPTPAATLIPRVPPLVAVGTAVVAGTAVAAGLALTDAARYGIGLLGARLFSRVQGKAALRNAIRGGIHDHVQANPGIRFNRLRRDLGLSHGATAYHLQVLEREGLVRSRTAWTTRHYYAGAAPAPSTPPAGDVILDFVRNNPGAGAAEVARNLGLSRQLAHYHLRRLAATGRLSSGTGRKP